MERAIGRTWRSDPPKKDRISEGIPVGISGLITNGCLWGGKKYGLEYKPSVKEGNFLDGFETGCRPRPIVTYTTVGIHRDDLVLNIGGYAVRKIGSQGTEKDFPDCLEISTIHWLHQMSEVKTALAPR